MSSTLESLKDAHEALGEAISAARDNIILGDHAECAGLGEDEVNQAETLEDAGILEWAADNVDELAEMKERDDPWAGLTEDEDALLKYLRDRSGLASTLLTVLRLISRR